MVRDWLNILSLWWGTGWMYSHYGKGLVECTLCEGLVVCTLTMVRGWLSVLSLWWGTGWMYSHYGEGLVECTLTMGRDWLSVPSLWEGTGWMSSHCNMALWVEVVFEYTATPPQHSTPQHSYTPTQRHPYIPTLYTTTTTTPLHLPEMDRCTKRWRDVDRCTKRWREWCGQMYKEVDRYG